MYRRQPHDFKTRLLEEVFTQLERMLRSSPTDAESHNSPNSLLVDIVCFTSLYIVVSLMVLKRV